MGGSRREAREHVVHYDLTMPHARARTEGAALCRALDSNGAPEQHGGLRIEGLCPPTIPPLPRAADTSESFAPALRRGFFCLVALA